MDVDEEPEEQLVVAGGGEVVHVQWGRILWITTRDQILSPLLQGALWCVSLARATLRISNINTVRHRGVASHFLRPLGAILGAHIRAWWVKGATRKDAPEGNGAHWLRSTMGSILTPSAAQPSPYAR